MKLSFYTFQQQETPIMLIEVGEKVHVMHRRVFETDLRRHFIGEVIAVSDMATRVRGYTFVFDRGKNTYYRLPERRCRIIPIVDASLIINIIPRMAKVDQAVYMLDKNGHIVVTDNETFSLDVNEFGGTH